jgi:hypothetical protein
MDEDHQEGLVLGAVGGAIAIAFMEFASARMEYPLMAIPFATSIVTVVGILVVKLAGPLGWGGGCRCR